MRRLALSLLLLAGCTTLPPAPDEHAIVGALIDTTLAAPRAPEAEQHRQLAAAREAYALKPDDANGLRVAALLLSLPPPLRDESGALALLAPVAARQPATPMTRFASLLARHLDERQRQARESEAALRRQESALRTAEGREEALQRRLEAVRAAEQREAAQLRRQAEALRASELREEMLKRQIEGLRASERGMIEREEKLGTKSR